MHAYVYKSLRKPDTYLYLRETRCLRPGARGRAACRSGRSSFVLEVELTPERRLARADADVVRTNLAGRGFHLQRPETRSIRWWKAASAMAERRSRPAVAAGSRSGLLLAWLPLAGFGRSALVGPGAGAAAAGARLERLARQPRPAGRALPLAPTRPAWPLLWTLAFALLGADAWPGRCAPCSTTARWCRRWCSAPARGLRAARAVAPVAGVRAGRAPRPATCRPARRGGARRHGDQCAARPGRSRAGVLRAGAGPGAGLARRCCRPTARLPLLLGYPLLCAAGACRRSIAAPIASRRLRVADSATAELRAKTRTAPPSLAAAAGHARRSACTRRCAPAAIDAGARGAGRGRRCARAARRRRSRPAHAADARGPAGRPARCCAS